jgi:regulatory protein
LAMRITAIKQQLKRSSYYSVFVENKYEFSLSDSALLDSKLARGQNLSEEQLEQYKQLSNDDKIYNRVLSYISLRPRTRWEIETYLKQKKTSPTLSESILNKLSDKALIDDAKFARAWVNDRRLLRPTSKRKLILELRQKRVEDEIIHKVLSEQDTDSDASALASLIESKRRQSKYQDDLKLMQYLARQGFSYGDIKNALSSEN